MFRSSSARIRIPSIAGAIAFIICLGTASAQKQPPATPLNLNTATFEELKLPGIAPKAKAIVDFRTRSGPFRRVEDLLAIKGISKARLEKLWPYVTVGPLHPTGTRTGLTMLSFRLFSLHLIF